MKQGKEQYRQGDVLLVAVDAFPPSAKKHTEPVRAIAIGEVQGHSHRLEGGNVATYDLIDGWLGIEVASSGVTLVHGSPGVYTPDAHRTQKVEKKKYIRSLQHEWDPNFDSVPVQD